MRRGKLRDSNRFSKTPDRCFYIFRHSYKTELFDSHFQESDKKRRARVHLTDLEVSNNLQKNPGSLGFPGCALLALLRPVPLTLALSLQRSRSVSRPVVPDVQFSHSPGAVDRDGDIPAIGRCGHRQISTVTRFQAHPSGLLHCSRGPCSRVADGSLLTGAILKARSAGGVLGSFGRSVVKPKLLVAGLFFVSSPALLHKLQVIYKIPNFRRARLSPNRCHH